MKKSSTQSHRYIKNPDVILREEDSDGALIFNPDTDQIRVLNPTGLFIWQLCNGTNDQAGITSALRESFDEIPEDQISQQVEDFIGEMATAGFIGTVEEQITGNN